MIPPRPAKRHGQSDPRPRNYFARREQLRLLFLVMLLGMVIWAIDKAADPNTWAWLWAAGQQGEAAAEQPAEPERGRNAVLPTEKTAAPILPKEGVDVGGDYFPGVEPKYFDAIDDHQAFWSDENPAWFNLLGVLKNNDARTLERGSTGPISYVQLMDQPNEYRGKLVTLRGTIRAAHAVTPSENDEGIGQLYRLTVRPANSRNVVMVWCLELPEGFPTGGDIQQDARITGFFFKIWMYTKDNKKSYTAPALLARTVDWLARPPAEPAEPPSALMTVVIVVAALAFSTVVIVFVWTKTRRPRVAEPDEPAGLEALEELDLDSPPPSPRDSAASKP